MLNPYTVLDLTDDKGEFASMILGDLGARVIKVESPEGSASRRIGPFLKNAPESERSLQFFAFNRNKLGITLDLEVDSGRCALLKLVETADFIFESARPSAMAEMGLGFEQLRAVNPQIIYTALTPFGQNGPYADYTASDLTLSALSGLSSVQGVPDRAPVRISVPQAWLHTCTEATIGALTAHALMLRTGEAQFVDVSAQAALHWAMLHARAAYAVQGKDFERAGSDIQYGAISAPCVYQCADGYVIPSSLGARLPIMVEWLVNDSIVPKEWTEREDWSSWRGRLSACEPVVYDMEEVVEVFRSFFLRYTKEELFELGLRDGVTIAPVNTVEDLARFRHLEERGYWLKAPLPDGREINAPGFICRPAQTPMTVRRWAPKLGQHNQEVLRGADNSTESISSLMVKNSVKRPTPNQELPFEGLKVVDLTWVVAGPSISKYFADHGATVVKVESERRVDGARTALGPFKDDILGINRSHAFGDHNTSKLSVTVDLKVPEGNDIARRLIAWADLYIEGYSPGTVTSLGLDFDTAKSLNESIIMVSTSLMGQSGPLSSMAGYGYHASGFSGFHEVTGWPDLPPDGPWTAYTDATSPRCMASTIMAAIDHRRRTGEGQYIDASQLEASLHFLSPQILDWNANGSQPKRLGNRSEVFAPHGVYRCSGEDQWCAIAVETKSQWKALCEIIDRPAWSTDPRFLDSKGRLKHHDELDEGMGQWTAEKTPVEVMNLLQSVGVPAGAVQRSSDLLQDPQLGHREFWRYLEHPETGKLPYTGHSFNIDGHKNGPRFHPPLLGEHNQHVMSDLLKMSDDEITDAVIAGAIG